MQLKARAITASEQVHWVECGYDALFLTKDGRRLREDRLPDGVHPNAAAWEALAACLDSVLAPLIAG